MQKYPLEKLDPQQKAIVRAIEIAGSQANLAHAIGVSQNYVSQWLHRNKRFPSEQLRKIEKALQKFGGHMTRDELRPDLVDDD